MEYQIKVCRFPWHLVDMLRKLPVIVQKKQQVAHLEVSHKVRDIFTKNKQESLSQVKKAIHIFWMTLPHKHHYLFQNKFPQGLCGNGQKCECLLLKAVITRFRVPGLPDVDILILFPFHSENFTGCQDGPKGVWSFPIITITRKWRSLYWRPQLRLEHLVPTAMSILKEKSVNTVRCLTFVSIWHL